MRHIQYIAENGRPLFERIQRPGISAGIRETKESIAREIGRILTTRCFVDYVPADSEERTIVDYGVPSVTEHHAQDPEGLQRYIQEISNSIQTYEPRLKNVEVVIDGDSERTKKLSVKISAKLPMKERDEVFEYTANIAI